MSRPKIGITIDTSDENATRYETPMDYGIAVVKAGGLPLLLPYRSDLSLIPEYVDALDGIVFSGGNDLDPTLYGETQHPNAVAIDPARQRFELALMAEVEKRRLPTLGICLGSQLMNVHRGGKLTQFLPDRHGEGMLEHRRLGDPTRRHPVHIEPGTELAAAIGHADIVANTRHKQAISEIGRELRITARAPDGVIEAIEDPSLPLFMAVQWHPENLAAAGEEDHLAIFRRLVQAAFSTR